MSLGHRKYQEKDRLGKQWLGVYLKCLRLSMELCLGYKWVAIW